MFGRRKKSQNTDESILQSSNLIENLEETDDLEEVESSYVDLEDLPDDNSEEDLLEEDILVEVGSQSAQEEEEEEPEKEPRRWGFFGLFGRKKKKVQLYEEEESEEEDYEEDDEEYEDDEIMDDDEEVSDEDDSYDEDSADSEEESDEDEDELTDTSGLTADAAALGLNPALFDLAREMEDEEDEEDDEEYEDDEDEYEDDEDDESEEDEDEEEYEDDEDEESEEDEDDEEDSEDDEEDDEEYDEDEEDEEDEEDSDDPIYMDDDGRASRKKILIGALAALGILAVAAFLIFRNMGKTPEGRAYVQKVSDIMEFDLSGTYVNRYSGIVEGQKQTKVFLEDGMTVSKCYVHVGDDVKKGDRLFAYDTDALSLQRKKKELEINQMNRSLNNLEKKKTEYEREQKNKTGAELLDLQDEALQAELQIETSKLELQQKQKELENIKKNIKNSVVKSKTNGIILKINTAVGKGGNTDSEDGDFTDSSNSTNSSGEYMIIVAKGDYQVRVKVPETSMQTDGLKNNAPVIVRSRISKATWNGTIKRIKTDETYTEDNSSDETSEDSDFSEDTETDSSSNTDSHYGIVVSLETSKGLMLGQHVLVELTSGSQSGKSDDNGYWLDQSYVVSENGKYYVYADNGKDRLVKKEIKVGEYDEDLHQYLIKSGLKSDDYISVKVNCKPGMATTKDKSKATNQNSSGGSDEESTEVDGLDEDFE